MLVYRPRHIHINPGMLNQQLNRLVAENYDKNALTASSSFASCFRLYDEYDGLPQSRVCHTKTFSQTLLRVGFTLGVAKVLTDFRANALCLRKATKIICHYKILEGLYRCSIMLLLTCRKGQALTSNSRPSKSDPD